MKISFLLDDNNIKIKFKIDVSVYIQIKELKTIICKHQKNIDETFFESHFDLIYNEFILNDNKILQFYKIKSGDEIWIGKIENYLQKDEIILEVFLIESIPEWMYLVVDMHCTTCEIINIIERVKIDFHYLIIWDKNGNYIFKNQVISEIDKIEGYHKILINCQGENNTFSECCQIHDRAILENYSANYQSDFLLFKNCYYMFELLVNPIKDLLNFDSTNYLDRSRFPELEDSVSHINISFQNIKFLFCTRIADRIFYVCKRFWNDLGEEIKKQSNSDYLSDSLNVFKIFYQFDDYFKIALLSAILIYLKNRENLSGNKSIRDIMNDSSKFLINPNTNWNQLVKFFLVEFLFDFLLFDKAADIIQNLANDEKYIMWKSPDGNFDRVRFSNINCTILNLKKEISRNTGVDVEHLYVISINKDKRPKNEDLFDYQEICHIEFISSMDDIKILDELGDGAFGKVLLCENLLSLQLFALKIPKENKNLFPDIFILNKLNKSIEFMRFYGLFNYDNSISVAIEYFSEGSLTSKIQILQKNEDQFSNFQLAAIAYQVLKQLKYLHDDKIIHGDIKCDNVVFDKDNCARLIDFGLAKYINGLSKEELIEYKKVCKPGTLIYMAPELLNNESYSNKIDIWSFGVMMVEMVLVKSPYVDNPRFAFIKIANSRKINYEHPNSLSPELKDFIDHCMESDPDERATIDELMESEFLKKNLI